MLHANIGRIPDLCWHIDLLRRWPDADLRWIRTDVYRLADMHRPGDLSQHSDLRSRGDV
jgi:hypothetical protein